MGAGGCGRSRHRPTEKTEYWGIADLSDTPSKGQIRHLLVVEDSAIIAMDIEMSAEQLGLAKVTTVPDAVQALALLDGDARDVDGALIDFFLAKGDGRVVAERLKTLDIPFALMTGFGDLAWLQAQVPRVPILAKPFSITELAATLDQLR